MIGYFRAQQGRTLTILERPPVSRNDDDAAPVADTELRLFKPVRNAACRAGRFPGEHDSYPGRDDGGAYLTDEQSEERLGASLPSSTAASTPCGSRTRAAPCRSSRPTETYEDLEQVDRCLRAARGVSRAVDGRGGLGDGVVQLHSGDDRKPGDLPAGTVLEVGEREHRAVQIAAELAQSRQVHLAVERAADARSRMRILGRELFRYRRRPDRPHEQGDQRGACPGQQDDEEDRETLIEAPSAVRREVDEGGGNTSCGRLHVEAEDQCAEDGRREIRRRPPPRRVDGS